MIYTSTLDDNHILFYFVSFFDTIENVYKVATIDIYCFLHSNMITNKIIAYRKAKSYIICHWIDKKRDEDF